MNRNSILERMRPSVPLSATILFLAGCLVVLGVAGCTATTAPDAGKGPPEATAGKLFLVADGGAVQVNLKRAGAEYKFQPPVGYPLISGDFVQNLSQGVFTVKGALDDCSFFLKPGAGAEFAEKSITLHNGSTRLVFGKIGGEFKVKIPFATLGIRGTQLIANVFPDKSSSVFLVEGNITVTSEAREIKLEAGKKLTVSSDGKTVQDTDISADEFLALEKDTGPVKLFQK